MKRSQDICNWRESIFRRKCRNDSFGQCVYCNLQFCESHGVVGPKYLEVCNDTKCMAKKTDIEMHQHWKHQVKAANEKKICAIESCNSTMERQCNRCQLIFCKFHLKVADIMEFGIGYSQKIPAVLCDHCFARRVIWDQ